MKAKDTCEDVLCVGSQADTHLCCGCTIPAVSDCGCKTPSAVTVGGL